MRRFLGFLLFTAFIALLYVTACHAACHAGEPAHLTISEPFHGSLVVPVYPPEVFSMTPREFYAWATQQNAKARADWDEWHKTAPPRWISYDGTTFDGYSNGPRHRSRVTATLYGVESRSTYGGYQHHHYTQQSFQKRFLNPDYVSRPLTIINPYCQPKRQFSNTTGVWLHHDSFHEVNP